MLPLAPADVLIIFAMREEAGGRFDGLGSPVLYTGIGKVNATWALTRALGLAPGVTPFDTLPSVLTVPRRYPSLPEGTCGSGDSFVAGHPVTACDVLDMEAYAIAKVCRLEGIDHMALKYVTDGGDADAHLHWAENLPRAAAAFRAAYDQIVAARS